MACLVLTQKLKERTDAFVSQKLQGQVHSLKEQMRAFVQYQHKIAEVYQRNLLSVESQPQVQSSPEKQSNQPRDPSIFLSGLQRIKFLQQKEAASSTSSHSKLGQSFLWEVFSEKRLISIHKQSEDDSSDEVLDHHLQTQLSRPQLQAHLQDLIRREQIRRKLLVSAHKGIGCSFGDFEGFRDVLQLQSPSTSYDHHLKYLGVASLQDGVMVSEVQKVVEGFLAAVVAEGASGAMEGWMGQMRRIRVEDLRVKRQVIRNLEVVDVLYRLEFRQTII